MIKVRSYWSGIANSGWSRVKAILVARTPPLPDGAISFALSISLDTALTLKGANVEQTSGVTSFDLAGITYGELKTLRDRIDALLQANHAEAETEIK